jgi:hypothetical protein
MLWHVIKCRRAWDELCEEIRVLKKEELTITNLNRLPYLDAAMQESI